jgi:hypothetical protein
MAAQLFRRSPHAVEMAIDNTVIVVDPVETSFRPHCGGLDSG